MALTTSKQKISPKSLKDTRVSRPQKTPLFYNWRLNGDIPERLLVKPVDQWLGCRDAAKGLIHNKDRMQNVVSAWDDDMHTFSFLRDLRSLSGGAMRDLARHMVSSWIKYNGRFDPKTWRVDIAGQRIAMWISHFDFYGVDSSEEFQDLFFESLSRQARHISRNLNQSAFGVAKLKGIKGLLYAGLAFEGHEPWVEHALTMLQKELSEQILSDGAHISRSPMRLQNALQVILDIRTALTAAGYPVAPHIHDTIRRMGMALRFFRYNDKGFALFNGAYEGDEALVDNILTQTGMRGKIPQSLYNAGFERVTLGRTLLMINGASSPPKDYQSYMHHAPLSFEMCYGRERVLTSCGSHISCEHWGDAMRSTSAHNALSLEGRDAIPSEVSYTRRTLADATLVEGSHDGYKMINGTAHSRSFYIANKGHDVRGEDVLKASVAIARATPISIRFHIHPNVLVSKVQEGTQVLMRLPGGIGWRFKQSGGVVALEDSVYLGCGKNPRKTKQIIIHSHIQGKEKSVKWAFRREG